MMAVVSVSYSITQWICLREQIVLIIIGKDSSLTQSIGFSELVISVVVCECSYGSNCICDLQHIASVVIFKQSRISEPISNYLLSCIQIVSINNLFSKSINVLNESAI